MTLSSKLDRLSVGVGAGLVAATLVVVVFFGSDSGAGTPAAAASKGAAVTRIVIRDFKFAPVSAVVKVGTKLTFVNDDTAIHTATSADDQTFDTDIIGKGAEKAVTLKRPGTVAYICAVHPFMKATLKVVR